jgi:hypothetical protein
MTLTSSFSVRVERPGKTFGDAMTEIRSWLDSHKIQSTGFTSDTKAPGPVAFVVRFAPEEEARLFEQAFT